jgi:hypothetical protein
VKNEEAGNCHVHETTLAAQFDDLEKRKVWDPTNVEDLANILEDYFPVLNAQTEAVPAPQRPAFPTLTQ